MSGCHFLDLDYLTRFASEKFQFLIIFRAKLVHYPHSCASLNIIVYGLVNIYSKRNISIYALLNKLIESRVYKQWSDDKNVYTVPSTSKVICYDDPFLIIQSLLIY